MPNWFDPDTLSASERAAAESPLQEIAGKGDFGAYAEANRTGAIPASLGGHNLIRVADRVAVYGKMLRRDFVTICDLGCGAGLTTAALARRYPGAKVKGFDISSEAVAWATRSYPEAAFEQRVLDADTDLGIRFDLVLAQEFYPFTRTGDFAVHGPWIGMLMRHIAPGGLALIVLSERDAHSTVLAHLDRAAALCADNGRRLTRTALPFDRVYHHLPLLWASRLASAALSLAGYDRITALKIE